MPANSVKITSSTKAMVKISKPVINPPRRGKMHPRDFPAKRVLRMPFRFVGIPAAPVHPAVLRSDRYVWVCWPPDARDLNAWPMCFASVFCVTESLNPALKFAQHQLPDDVHAGIAVVQAGDSGKLLAAIVLEDLGVFLRDLFERFQAIGGETGHHDGDAAHAVLCQLFDGLVGVGLKPFVEAKARLECELQLR